MEVRLVCSRGRCKLWRCAPPLSCLLRRTAVCDQDLGINVVLRVYCICSFQGLELTCVDVEADPRGLSAEAK